jgi:hypothetical protein
MSDKSQATSHCPTQATWRSPGSQKWLDAAALDTAKAVFLYVIQFLYLASKINSPIN